jgi:hypothetical protein
MKSELREYLKHFIPCKCVRTDTDKEMWLIGVDDHGENWHPDDKCVKFEGYEWKWSAVETHVKPKLRPYSSMTQDEIAEHKRIGNYSVPGEMPLGYKMAVKAKHEAEQTAYLFKIKIDVLGWIEKDIAVDATK